MSINLDNPESLIEKIDAARNFVGETGALDPYLLAFMACGSLLSFLLWLAS